MSFSEFIRGAAATQTLIDYDNFFFFDEILAVEQILLFERYEEDISSLCSFLGIKLPVRKFGDIELKEQYADLGFAECKKISECISIAIDKYNSKMDSTLRAPILTVENSSSFKEFVAEHLDQLANYFLNSYHLKLTKAFIRSEKQDVLMKRELDFYFYYENLPDKKSVTTRFKESCPRIFELGQYDLELP